MSKDKVIAILNEQGYNFLAEEVNEIVYINECANTSEEIFGLPNYILQTLNTKRLKGLLKTWMDKKFIENIFTQYDIKTYISPSQFLYISKTCFYEELGVEFNESLFKFLADYSEKISVEGYNNFFEKKEMLIEYYYGPDIPSPKEVKKYLSFFEFVEDMRRNETYIDLRFNQYMTEQKLDFLKDGYLARRPYGFQEYCQVISQVPHLLGITVADILKCITHFDIDFVIITKEGKFDPYMIFVYYDSEIMYFEKLKGIMNLEDFCFIESLYLERGYDYACLIRCFEEMINNGQEFSKELIEYIRTKRGDDN